VKLRLRRTDGEILVNAMTAKLSRPATSPLRRHWHLAPGIVFLNHGSFGACPKPILKLQTELRQKMESEPVQFLWRRYEERLEPVRAALARFVGARARDLVFVTNATAGVNAVVRSLELKRGDELLTTNCAYNACRNVVVEAARRAGAKVVVAEVPFPLRSADEIVAAVLRAVTRRTRLAMLDHITSDTALVFPIARLIRELEARVVDTLVDGAHAPGMLPLRIDRLNPAYYTGNLHKWVCAPKGAAFLWVREDKQAAVQPAVISHGNNRPRPGYSVFQDRFDWCGTFDPSAWLCVGAAIDWLRQRAPGGWAELRARNHALAVQGRRLLCERLQVEPPCPESMLGAIATIPLPARFQSSPRTGKIDREQLRLYDEFGIEVPFSRIGPKAARCFRISAQIYNTVADYEYLAEALAML
jgi:isopenicillin-N epimerase